MADSCSILYNRHQQNRDVSHTGIVEMKKPGLPEPFLAGAGPVFFGPAPAPNPTPTPTPTPTPPVNILFLRDPKYDYDYG